MTINAPRPVRGRPPPGGITPAETADILWTYSSPEHYELLVIRRRWSAERYGRFVAQALIAALFPDQDR